MSDGVAACLDRLESAIDLDWEREKIETYKRLLDFQPFEPVFDATRCEGGADPGPWPEIGVNEAIRDKERMLLHQLGTVYSVVCRRSLLIPNIRCNYGTGCLSSLFGAEVFWMDDALGTLPTTWPLRGEDAMDRLLAAGVPDLNAGFGAQIFETAEYFKDMLAPYPKTQEAVWIYHPDLQGPTDVVELLWGSPMYYAFYEEPEKIHAVTDLVCETYIRFMKRWRQVVPPRGNAAYMAHWGGFYKGQVMLRDDSIVNLSPEMYATFVKPYDVRVLETFGGGGIHFCGRADHCIDLMTDSKWLTVVNMSQPQLNDMQRIFDATVRKGVILNVRPTDEMRDSLDLSRGVMAR